jgi:serine/threonine protein kinase
MRFTRSGLGREQREARAAASVRHPNVVSVFHLGESGGSYFYAMEFVEGETLENLIRRLGSVEPDMGLEVTAQVAAGLAAIQKQHLACCPAHPKIAERCSAHRRSA